MSIFSRYYTPETLTDRYLRDPQAGVEVIIPVMHTNELWESNLHSIYREIPVKRLLLGDGGCVDDTLERARKFPRVEVQDHRQFKSLGYSIRKLIEAVDSEWFIYLHSDVWLPEGWFDTMSSNKGRYDWFECRQHLTIMLDYPLDYSGSNRPFSGSQMGRKDAFKKVLPKVDDDFLYRNEDIIFADMVKREGFRYGRVDETFHYHQHMARKSAVGRKVFVDYRVEESKEEEVRSREMQAKGLIKYMEPTPELSIQVWHSTKRLVEIGALNWAEFRDWVGRTNPKWLPYIYKKWPVPRASRDRVISVAKKVYRRILGAT